MMRWPRRRLLAGAAALALPALTRARPLRSGDHVTVLPTLAHRAADGHLALRIEAWVFERERNPTRTRLLARALGLELDELNDTDRSRFAQRTALFGADAKDGRELQAQVADADVALALPPSDAQGRIRAVLPYAAAARAGQWIDWAVLGGARRFASRALWIGEQGLSVVCDIDDTVKHTQVRSRRQMLLNTFAREFVAVPGMAAWLQRVVLANDDTSLHYVSGSPLQLTPALLAFVRDAGLPAGSLHPRTLSLSPAALLDDEATTRHKHAEIAQLLADHPRRRFLLVGDSGERDPEIYGAIAREHAARIAAVLIRDVSGEGVDSARYAQAFAGVDPARWQLFVDPATLPTRLA